MTNNKYSTLKTLICEFVLAGTKAMAAGEQEVRKHRGGNSINPEYIKGAKDKYYGLCRATYVDKATKQQLPNVHLLLLAPTLKEHCKNESTPTDKELDVLIEKYFPPTDSTSAVDKGKKEFVDSAIVQGSLTAQAPPEAQQLSKQLGLPVTTATIATEQTAAAASMPQQPPPVRTPVTPRSNFDNFYPLIPGTKHGSRDWNKTLPGTYTRAQCGRDAGIVLAVHELVLDFDLKHYPAGRDLWAEMARDFPELQTTKINITRTSTNVLRSIHVYLTVSNLPPNTKIKRAQFPYPGVEFKTDTIRDIGSVDDETGSTVEACIKAPVIEIPEKLLISLQLITYGADDKSIDAPTLENEGSFIQELHAMPGAHEGERNNMCFKLACRGHDRGLPQDNTYTNIRDIWAPKCIPPMHHDIEIYKTVESAYTGGARSAFGCDTAEAAFKDVEPPPPTENNSHQSGSKPESSKSEGEQIKSGFAPITFGQLRKKPHKPQRHLIRGLLAYGLTVVAGAPKSYKSWMMLVISIALASGRKAFGVFPTEQVQVLYLGLEDPERRINERLNTLLDDETDPQVIKNIDENLFLDTEILKQDKGGLEQLDDYLNKQPGIKVVIIDTKSNFTPDPSNKGTAYDVDSKYMNELRKFGQRRDIAVLLVTHTNKTRRPDDKFDKITGSTGIVGSSETNWLMVRTKQKNSIVLSLRGKEVEEQAYGFKFDNDTCQLTFEGDAEQVQRTKERQVIIDYLNKKEIPAGPKEVAEALELPYNNVKSLMNLMYKDGELDRPYKGRYTVRTNDTIWKNFSPPNESNKSTDAKSVVMDIDALLEASYGQGQ